MRKEDVVLKLCYTIDLHVNELNNLKRQVNSLVNSIEYEEFAPKQGEYSIDDVVDVVCKRIGVNKLILQERGKKGSLYSETRRVLSCLIMEFFWSTKYPRPLSYFSEKIGIDQSSLRSLYKDKHLMEHNFLDIYLEMHKELKIKNEF